MSPNPIQQVSLEEGKIQTQKHREKAAVCRPRRGFRNTLILVSSSLQSLEKINSCCLSRVLCGTLFCGSPGKLTQVCWLGASEGDDWIMRGLQVALETTEDVFCSLPAPYF